MSSDQFSNIQHWCTSIQKGDVRALSKALTLVESTTQQDIRKAMDLCNHAKALLRKENFFSRRIGITGPPGVGKSSFIEALGLHICGRGVKLAVFAVDPSSPVSGGSILGDKVRMEKLSALETAYIRPSPLATHSASVTKNLDDTMLLLELAQFDYVLIESVGVGQSEISIVDFVDKVLLLHQPGSGDDLQAVKRGILELGDAVIVTKADGELKVSAQSAVLDLKASLPSYKRTIGSVMEVSSKEGYGLDTVAKLIDELFSDRALIEARRLEKRKKIFKSKLESSWSDLWKTNQNLKAKMLNTLDDLKKENLTTTSAVSQLIEKISFIVQ